MVQAGADITRRHGDELTRLPFLRTWFRTRNAIVLHLSNGTLQVSNDSLKATRRIALNHGFYGSTSCCKSEEPK